MSEIDIIVYSTGSFNIISFECFHWKHRTLDNEIDFTGSEAWND